MNGRESADLCDRLLKLERLVDSMAGELARQQQAQAATGEWAAMVDARMADLAARKKPA